VTGEGALGGETDAGGVDLLKDAGLLSVHVVSFALVHFFTFPLSEPGESEVDKAGLLAFPPGPLDFFARLVRIFSSSSLEGTGLTFISSLLFVPYTWA
jgi:hypothetical protein